MTSLFNNNSSKQKDKSSHLSRVHFRQMGRTPKPRLPDSQGRASASMPARVRSPEHGKASLSEGATSSPEKSLVLTEIANPLVETIEPLLPITVRDTAQSRLKRKSKSTESSDTLKLLKQSNGEVRRSVHLQNAIVSLTDPSPDSTPLTIADDENVQLCNEKPVALPSSAENNVVAKVSRLEKQMEEALLSSMNAFHSKVQELNLRRCTHRADADNGTLHLDCRKKIDELMIANHDLISKLEDTQNKVELYEKRQRLLELSKDAEQLP